MNIRKESGSDFKENHQYGFELNERELLTRLGLLKHDLELEFDLEVNGEIIKGHLQDYIFGNKKTIHSVGAIEIIRMYIDIDNQEGVNVRWFEQLGKILNKLKI